MSGPVVLHGGGEFEAGDEPCLAAMVERAARHAGGDRPIRICVVPTAAGAVQPGGVRGARRRAPSSAWRPRPGSRGRRDAGHDRATRHRRRTRTARPAWPTPTWSISRAATRIASRRCSGLARLGRHRPGARRRRRPGRRQRGRDGDGPMDVDAGRRDGRSRRRSRARRPPARRMPRPGPPLVERFGAGRTGRPRARSACPERTAAIDGRSRRHRPDRLARRRRG